VTVYPVAANTFSISGSSDSDVGLFACIEKPYTGSSEDNPDHFSRSAPGPGNLQDARRAASAIEPHCDHDTRNSVEKNLLLRDFQRGSIWHVSGLYEIDRDRSVAGSQDAGRDFDNRREIRGNTDYTDALRIVSGNLSKALCSAKLPRQWLSLGRRKDVVAIALHIAPTIQVITCMNVPAGA
jgi:hypothetical protein